MTLVAWPRAASPGAPRAFLEEAGVGADALAALKGRPAIDEPQAYSERHFGSVGAYLRRRRWSLDFYLGSFSDLSDHYQKLGYRRVYRLRAPYVSYGKEAWILAPEPGLRPRLIHCGFSGRDQFLRTRAQWAILAGRDRNDAPVVRTVSCPECGYVLPGVRAMVDLIGTVPYEVENVIVGYPELFEAQWKESRIGVYENDYWRLSYYRIGPQLAVTVAPRRSNVGEIMAVSLTPLVRRGAKRVYYAGPAVAVDPRLDARTLLLPTEFAAFGGLKIPFDNALLSRWRRPARLVAVLPSTLFATREWLKYARIDGIAAFDDAMGPIAEEAESWALLPGKVKCGIGAVLGGLSSLHPEEARSRGSFGDENVLGAGEAKARYRDEVLAQLAAAGATNSD